MKTFNSIHEILEFAMTGEQGAIDLYTRLAGETTISEMKQIFLQFAREEMGHKARLMKIRDEGIMDTVQIKVTDMDYRDALVLAMSREKAAFKLYSRLAEQVTDSGLKNLFLSLAQEEAKHKLRFELEYDEFVLRDN
jgi:rubrerythrin